VAAVVQLSAHPRRSALLPERPAATAVVATRGQQRARAASGASGVRPATHILTTWDAKRGEKAWQLSMTAR